MTHSKLWIGVGALVLAAAGFTSLGFWQLERAAFNRTIEESFRLAEELPRIDRPVSAAEAEALRYRRIGLSGFWEPERQILLDNMTHAGQAGYEVLTPLRVAGSRLVLVNRGWVPASPDRRQLPDVGLDRESAEIAGRIDRLPRAALDLGAAEAVRAGPLAVMSFPDFAAVEDALGREVFPFIVLLDPAGTDGFVRDWAPEHDRDERNIAYAVQWFGLALLAFGLAVGIVFRSRSQRGSGGR